MWIIVQYLWLSIEITFNTGSLVSHRLEFLLYGLGWIVGYFLYMAVALNRVHFVFSPGGSGKFWCAR